MILYQYLRELRMTFNLFHKLSSALKKPFSVKLPDSSEIKFGEQYGHSQFQVDIKTRKALQAVETGDELAISEAYIYGDIDLNGNIDMLELLTVKNLFSKAHPYIIRLTRLISFLATKLILIKKVLRSTMNSIMIFI